MEYKPSLLLYDSEIRHQPIPASVVSNKNLVNVLANILMSWPLRDVRLEPIYNQTDTDSNEIKNIANTMKLSIQSKDLSNNTLVCIVSMLSNMAEIQYYQNKANIQQSQYEEMGQPTYIINPTTGDKVSVNHNTTNIPEKQYTPTVKITYQISLVEDIFTLAYAAKNLIDNQIIYYNIVQKDDLSYLIRRSIHELWGNPTIFSDKGPFLEGIPMLISGKKYPYYKNNPQPTFLDNNVSLKKPQKFKVDDTIANLCGNLLIYVLPIIAILSIIIISIYCLSNMDASPGYDIISFPKHIQSLFFSTILIGGITSLLGPKIGILLKNKADNLKLKNKFS